jgi:hypothetical protein
MTAGVSVASSPSTITHFSVRYDVVALRSLLKQRARYEPSLHRPSRESRRASHRVGRRLRRRRKPRRGQRDARNSLALTVFRWQKSNGLALRLPCTCLIAFSTTSL